jgi:hypothetical protein
MSVRKRIVVTVAVVPAGMTIERIPNKLQRFATIHGKD